MYKPNTDQSNILLDFVRDFNTEYDDEVIRMSDALYAEFNRKKSAWALKMTTRKTKGTIDMGRIFAYKTSDDIFKRKTMQPKGKSHGVVVLIDNSASMRSDIVNVIENAVSIGIFCKRVNIPFYAIMFTTGYNGNKNKEAGVTNPLDVGSVKMTMICSPQTTNEEFKNIVLECKLSQKQQLLDKLSREQQQSIGNTWSQDMTPLGISYLGTFEIAAQLKASNIDHVTLISLTDGDGNCSLTSGGKAVNIITNPFNQQTYKIRDFETHRAWNSTKMLNSDKSIISMVNKMSHDMGIETHHIFITSNSERQYGSFDVPTKLLAEFQKESLVTFNDVLGYNRITMVNRTNNNVSTGTTVSDVNRKLKVLKLKKVLASHIIDTICRKYA